jgi:hypothetical protein
MALAQIGETARLEAKPGSATRRDLHYKRIELLYEFSFLRIFLAWEAFLEQVFFRYLCGYASIHGTAVLQQGASFAPTLAHAESAVLSGKDYQLWHDAATVVARSERFFTECPLERVLRSNVARLRAFAAIRHRIAHGQADARKKFDAATMVMAGRRYSGSRPGAFLRDRDVTVAPPLRWLEVLGRELQGLAIQIS